MQDTERQELKMRHVKGFLACVKELQRIIANVEGHAQKLALLLEEEHKSVIR